MGNIFAGSEVVEIGIQIEKNGRELAKTVKADKEAIDIGITAQEGFDCFL